MHIKGHTFDEKNQKKKRSSNYLVNYRMNGRLSFKSQASSNRKHTSKVRTLKAKNGFNEETNAISANVEWRSDVVK